MLIPRLEKNLREIEGLELEIKEEEQQLSLFPSESLADVFDQKMTDINISPVDVKKVINDLRKRKSTGRSNFSIF